MPVYDRTRFNVLLDAIKQGKHAPLYLLFGERYLSQQSADQLAAALCAQGGNIHSIDGDTEDIPTTLAKLRSFSLFGGRQVFRVNGSRLFLSKNVAEALWKRVLKARASQQEEALVSAVLALLEAGGLEADEDLSALSPAQWKKCLGFSKPSESLAWLKDLPLEGRIRSSSKGTQDVGEQLVALLDLGIPPQNTLLLVAEHVDKRKKLYKTLSAAYPVVDLSLDTGSSAQAKKGQEAVLREQVQQTLQRMGKRMAPGVLEQFLERVGFHPAAVVMETEKLALYMGDEAEISLEALHCMVGRTREEAIFELTEALAQGKVEQVLLLASRLQDQGFHALAVLASLRLYTRSLLLCRSLQEQESYGFRPGISVQAFQEQCLPALKQNTRWKEEFSGHPYAVYMKFKTASAFSLPLLRQWFTLILCADRRLKGSPVDADTIIQHLLLSMLHAR